MSNERVTKRPSKSGAGKSKKPGTKKHNLKVIPTLEYHPIAQVVDMFLARLRDIEELQKVFYPLAIQHRKNEATALHKEAVEVEGLLKRKTAASEIQSIKALEKIIRAADRLQRSNFHNVLQASLFNQIFSAFDAFTGELLSTLYRRRPELFARVNRTLSASEILKYPNIEDIKSRILNDAVETFRRKSYVEQFEELESSFGVKLREFEHWGDFVECSQRRNLFTHCDGVVSEQYLAICRSNGYSEIEKTKVGDRLAIDVKYFLHACEVMAEVSFKLAHVLWRKVLPPEHSDADKYLNRTLYDVLLEAKWKRGQVFGEFAVTLPKFSSDLDKRISTVNYAIALKFGGKVKQSQELLSTLDWSATAPDFKIAHAVLTDDFARAAKLMADMGESGDLLTEDSYHTWPLFYEFRQSPVFIRTYRKIYRRPFVLQLQKAATSTSAGNTATNVAT